MKTIWMVMAAMVVLGGTARAQESPAIGVKAGVNFATLSFDDEEDIEPSNRTGLLGGLFATIPVTGRLSFQPEVIYSVQGAEFTVANRSGQIKGDFINVPLLASINLSSGAGPRVALLAGPQIGFRTKAELELDGETEDFSDRAESIDIGLVGGAAVTVRNLVFDARYTWGVRDLSKEADTARNRVISLSVGVLFR